LEQLMQLWPFFPHAWSESPSTQLPFWQQPLHDPAPHGGWAMHSLFWQLPPLAEQSAQAIPPFPQAVFDVPAMHRPLVQQPFAQVAAPQVGAAAHIWPIHVWPSWEQSWQGSPLLPQTLSRVPTLHTPLAAQQPIAQLAASHMAPEPVLVVVVVVVVVAAPPFPVLVVVAIPPLPVLVVVAVPPFPVLVVAAPPPPVPGFPPVPPEAVAPLGAAPVPSSPPPPEESMTDPFAQAARVEEAAIEANRMRAVRVISAPWGLRRC
jgi:hypothetical protein